MLHCVERRQGLFFVRPAEDVVCTLRPMTRKPWACVLCSYNETEIATPRVSTYTLIGVP